MDDDEDDFFAYQTAKSLNNKRSQLKQYLQAPTIVRQYSSSSHTESDDENVLTLKKKSKPIIVEKTTDTIIIPSKESFVETKDLIKNKIESIVTSCFASNSKPTKRKIKLGKRTAADDLDAEEEDEYLNQISEQNGRGTRYGRQFLNRSQLIDDEEKVTRETAAYDRLEAVLRVTKPLCDKINPFDNNIDENSDEKKSNEDDHDEEIDQLNHLEKIILKIEHADGRQLNFSLPPTTTLKNLHRQVSDSLSIPSVSLVYNNQTIKIDEENQMITLKDLEFSTNEIHLIESYPIHRKLRIYIQTSTNPSDRRSSSIPSKREYKMMDTDRFEKIFDQYKNDYQLIDVRFEFDGETIHPKALPTDYEIDDGEVLDAFIISKSNNSNLMKMKNIQYDDESE